MTLGFDENLSDSDSDTCSEVTCHGLFEVLPDPHTQFVVQSVNGPVATADDQVDPIVKHKGMCSLLSIAQSLHDDFKCTWPCPLWYDARYDSIETVW